MCKHVDVVEGVYCTLCPRSCFGAALGKVCVLQRSIIPALTVHMEKPFTCSEGGGNSHYHYFLAKLHLTKTRDCMLAWKGKGSRGIECFKARSSACARGYHKWLQQYVQLSII